MPVITVSPSNRIFDELGNNTYDIPDLFSELIDNSLAARVDDYVNIDFDLYLDEDNKINVIKCRDDASGISLDYLGTVISPGASITDNPLNEHGMGLKQTVAAIGKLKRLATKTSDSNKTYVINKFGWGDIDVLEEEPSIEHGTEIVIDVKPDSNLRNRERKWYESYLKNILGARYRYFLNPNNRKTRITFTFYNNKCEYLTDIDIQHVNQIYYNPYRRDGEPVIKKHTLTGKDWCAKLTFGYAPDTDDEWDQLVGIDKPDLYHPYRLTMSHQGLDIIINNRVLLFHQLQDIGLVEAKHPQFNNIRGEIELISGFKTSVTKNAIIKDANFQECMSLVKGILNGDVEVNGTKKRYLRRKTSPTEIPEACLRDRLKDNLDELVLYHSRTLETEHIVEGIEGSIDLLAEMEDGSYEAWELKNERAIAKDVYQLFMYMDVEKITKGYLLAPEFSDGAKYACDFVNEKHGLNIELTTLSSYNIDREMSNQELLKY